MLNESATYVAGFTYTESYLHHPSAMTAADEAPFIQVLLAVWTVCTTDTLWPARPAALIISNPLILDVGYGFQYPSRQ